jgi:large subunit ribosomal protein L16
MLIVKNRKYRKAHKNVKKSLRSNSISKTQSLTFGSYGLKALTGGWIKASQIEAVRRVIVRQIRGLGKIWIRIFPDKPITQKPTKTRMGKGKGAVQYWVCPVAPGRLLYEVRGSISQPFAKELLLKASVKLPISTKFVSSLV